MLGYIWLKEEFEPQNSGRVGSSRIPNGRQIPGVLENFKVFLIVLNVIQERFFVSSFCLWGSI